MFTIGTRYWSKRARRTWWLSTTVHGNRCDTEHYRTVVHCRNSHRFRVQMISGDLRSTIVVHGWQDSLAHSYFGKSDHRWCLRAFFHNENCHSLTCSEEGKVHVVLRISEERRNVRVPVVKHILEVP